MYQLLHIEWLSYELSFEIFTQTEFMADCFCVHRIAPSDTLRISFLCQWVSKFHPVPLLYYSYRQHMCTMVGLFLTLILETFEVFEMICWFAGHARMLLQKCVIVCIFCSIATMNDCIKRFMKSAGTLLNVLKFSIYTILVKADSVLDVGMKTFLDSPDSPLSPSFLFSPSHSLFFLIPFPSSPLK